MAMVFKNAVTRSADDSFGASRAKTSDIDLLIPHQANLRIAEMVQKRLG